MNCKICDEWKDDYSDVIGAFTNEVCFFGAIQYHETFPPDFFEDNLETRVLYEILSLFSYDGDNSIKGKYLEYLENCPSGERLVDYVKKMLGKKISATDPLDITSLAGWCVLSYCLIEEHKNKHDTICANREFFSSLQGKIEEFWRWNLQQVNVIAATKIREIHQNRERAPSGGARQTEKKHDRLKAWFAHLDALALRSSWLAKSDPQKLREARASFDMKQRADPALADLFRRCTKRWFENTMDEWRVQFVARAEISERKPPANHKNEA